MRYFVMSDPHGGVELIRRALALMADNGCEALVLLGDLLNHGPRNRLPDDYAPPQVAELLNACPVPIWAVRGNCDSEVDGMMFNFPVNAAYGWIFVDTATHPVRIFLTHGHLHDFKSPAGQAKIGLKSGDFVLSGHTHVSGIFDCGGGIININPGSPTLPKGGSIGGFAIIDREEIRLIDPEGRIWARQPLVATGA